MKSSPKETIGIASNFYDAKLAYSQGSTGHRPENIVVKESLVGDRGRSEVNFYEKVKGEESLPLPEYFGYIEISNTEPLCLLFGNLSASHFQTKWPVIPNMRECRLAVAALARMHANWWGRPDEDQVPTSDSLDREIQRLKTFYPDYIEFVGEYLSGKHRHVYSLVFDKLAEIRGNRSGDANLTMAHTDPHFWNFLYPKDTDRNHCVLFDWPLWRIGFCGDDLAYMIALHLYPEHRRRFEPILLHVYLENLNRDHVDYSWDDLQLDYRLGVINGLLMPLQEFAWKVPPDDWLPKLEKAFAAFDDLDCLSLLE